MKKNTYEGRVAVLGMLLSAVAGCTQTSEPEPSALETTSSALSADRHRVDGRQLFEEETFGGNGRTCATCHPASAYGTLAPSDIQRLYRRDPRGPLFRALDSDDGTGRSYSRLLRDATIRVTLDLPAGWSLEDEPRARTVTVTRGIPTTLNVPALDPILMYDGRNESVEEQAHGAVNAHYQPRRQPTGRELDAIADFEQTPAFFSNATLRRYAKGGPAPELPPGRTASEKRGRKWYVPSVSGVCGHCHAGPMLNTTSEFLIGGAPGLRFFTAFVSELNKKQNPVRTFVVKKADGTTERLQSPDPGRALITGNLADANLFRIPTLWGSADTAPYFHDNSARTLEDLAQHYSDYFQIVGLPPLTADEQKDILAYLKLL